MTVILKVIFLYGIFAVSFHENNGLQLEKREAARYNDDSFYNFEPNVSGDKNNRNYKCQGYYDCTKKLDKKKSKIESLKLERSTLLTTLTTSNAQIIEQSKMTKRLKPQNKKLESEVKNLKEKFQKCSDANNININTQAEIKTLIDKVESIMDETSTMCSDSIDGFTIFNGDTGVYHISTTVASWWTAQNECRIHGMNLVTIDNMDENTYIKNKILASNPAYTDFFWIGLNNFATNDDAYTWIGTGQGTDQYTSDGTTSTTDWATNEPSTVATANCGAISSVDNPVTQLAWYSDFCVQTYYYICELPPICSHLNQKD